MPAHFEDIEIGQVVSLGALVLDGEAIEGFAKSFAPGWDCSNGALQQIYAHLNSLFCWDRLMARHVERWNAENPPAANA